MKVREIIDGIIKKTGVEPLPYERTCDHLMMGSMDAEVTCIATTFMATVDVIKRAQALGAELIITHEPTWFTGKDDTDWLDGDPVFERKKQLIESTGVTIWRFHDHMHFADDDGIRRGFDEELGWGALHLPLPAEGFISAKEARKDEHFAFDFCYNIPRTTLGELCALFADKLDMRVVQAIGDMDMPIERVALLPGGGSLGLGVEEMPMQLMRRYDLDLIVCGDILEWTLPSYVRDAQALGINKAILVLGHERSEEAGMKHLGSWLKSITGDIPVHHLDAKEPFTYWLDNNK